MNKCPRMLRQTGTVSEVYHHLESCDESFKPPLSSRVDLLEYSEKLFSKSETYEAWESGALVGLLAVYNDCTKGQYDFITNLSVVPAYQLQGVAGKLFSFYLEERAQEHSFTGVELEVDEINEGALKFYGKWGFTAVSKKDSQIRMRMQSKG